METQTENAGGVLPGLGMNCPEGTIAVERASILAGQVPGLMRYQHRDTACLVDVMSRLGPHVCKECAGSGAVQIGDIGHGCGPCGASGRIDGFVVVRLVNDKAPGNFPRTWLWRRFLSEFELVGESPE